MESHTHDPSGGSALIGLIIIIIFIALYFIPTFVAIGRKINKPGGVIAINALAGWTLLGWVAALVMAFSMETKVDYQLRTQALMTVAKLSERKD